MDRRQFLKVSGLTTAAIALGTTGLLSLGENGRKALAAPRPTRGSFGGMVRWSKIQEGF
ncbi:twin-arginine translocation signal domain-containing protein [Novibacillus thermophilus]|uniref:twin-arginine translocation signal domain-containing protein n=1 Tax=Novibacillus thermophilus TaxID=1471761 RepID=UPI001E3F921B|nr:twin-arginine translocation signal domain-containing protein [Novibacillus thermophilus]